MGSQQALVLQQTWVQMPYCLCVCPLSWQVAILFERGRPYILSNITLNKKGGHHVGLRAAYAMVMVRRQMTRGHDVVLCR